MGIRFYCPNGHKLNVKEFQAGLKGVCPICGVTMEVPLQSTRPSSKEKKSRTAREVPETSTPASKSPVDTAADPVVDANKVAWYVRPPSGGQYGPATADVMQTWLDEGRISADTLVWREGWSDWRRADGVFSQLSTGPASFSLDDIVSERVSTPIHSHPRKRPNRARNIPTIVISVLVVIALVLSVALLIALV